MVSEATITITKMLETLPVQLEDRVIEHLREYIEVLRDEAIWTDSFTRTQDSLINAARQARKEISEGKSTGDRKHMVLPH
ncbi:MAG: hypothetical protein PF693_08535 [Spirochaetia bacterium]|jgi:hypothetical protein|nr:hypothetical protein [Spirochaetia bacterium]